MTPRLLDLLDQAHAQATFFPIASRILHQFHLIDRMLTAGHVVGLHCDEHVRHSDRDIHWLRRDTDSALSALSASGVDATLWRTPWGDIAPWTATVAEERGLTLIGWDVDTHDWRGDDAATMFAATRKGLVPGAVVLAHDGIGPGARRADSGETLRYVQRVIGFAHDHAIPLRALS